MMCFLFVAVLLGGPASHAQQTAETSQNEAAADTSAQLRVSRLFADGMVIQRDAAVPVLGWAAPGTTVEVRFGGETYTAEAGADSAWSVTLPDMAAGGPHVMTIEAEAERIDVKDILVGDVWIASGQSNMEWEVADARDAEEEIASAFDPSIRHFKVPHSWAMRPEQALAGGTWQPAVPEHVGSFTAVGYFFARELREHVDVPIGLIHTSWGGSRIEPWMSAESLGLGDEAFDEIMAREREREERLREQLREKFGSPLPTEDAGLRGDRALWAEPDLDDDGWMRIPVPHRWEEVGFEGMDGIAWYRTSFELSEEQASEDAVLGLGMIDDADVTWVNGHKVGGMEMAWNQAREYDVPASVLRPGTNVIAVRVEDTGGGGGIVGSTDLLYVEAAGERRPLAREWKFNAGRVEVGASTQYNQIPTLLYNKMIHPLLQFPIAGAIWYQGESNAYPEQAYEYRDLFKTMISDWRARWNSGRSDGAPRDFPFLWVQLANYMAPSDEPGESDWAMLRESQAAALEMPNTGQAVAIDVGEADDIHPRNKQAVGRRLAQSARAVAYGHDVAPSGPQYVGHAVRDGQIVLAFANVGGGLRARGGDLGGFAIAGPDGEFVWANAKIEGETVVVWSDRVDDPLAVRYAWADNPDRANLYNREGLPAVPFRTDDW